MALGKALRLEGLPNPLISPETTAALVRVFDTTGPGRGEQVRDRRGRDFRSGPGTALLGQFHMAGPIVGAAHTCGKSDIAGRSQ